jgi:hypothetical protein
MQLYGEFHVVSKLSAFLIEQPCNCKMHPGQDLQTLGNVILNQAATIILKPLPTY